MPLTWTLAEVAVAAGGALRSGASDATVAGVSTDTRTLRPGQAFVAIPGDRFDGREFVRQAAAGGAGCVVVDSAGVAAALESGVAVVEVRDPVAALAGMARRARAGSQIPWVATTGSAGKTTTKEMIAVVASARGSVLKAPASFNNRIGVPLTVLGLTHDHVAASVEIGTSAPGEIAELAGIVRPTVAVVTNVGPAHLGGFGSLDAIAREKSEILAATWPEGLAVLPADSTHDEILRRRWSGRVVTFGLSPTAEVRADTVEVLRDGGTEFTCDGTRFCLRLAGLGNVQNALAAIAVADELGVSRSEAAGRLAGMEPLAQRGRVRAGNGLRVYEDCYNANPLSFGASLGAWLLVPGAARRWVVAGEMRELGDESPRLHEQLGGKIARAGAEFLIAVGDRAADIARGATEGGMPERSIVQVSTAREASTLAPRCARAGDLILIKGSRAVGLECVVEALLGLPA